MPRFAKSCRSSSVVTFAIAAVVAATGLHREARASLVYLRPNPAVTTFSALVHDNLDFTNSNANLNIGIGDTDAFVGSGSGTVIGAVEFAAANVGQFRPDGIAVAGGATFGNTNIDTEIAGLAGLSTTLSGEPGTPLTITAGGSVPASTGILDASGNLVFTATVGSSFTSGTTFTITGASDQSVIINVPSTPLAFDGSIVLAGGLAPDDVLFNFFSSFTTLNIDTGGGTTEGTFLVPNAPFQIIDTTLDGRIFGGSEVADSSITSSTIDSPPPIPAPEPTSLALLGVGLAAYGLIRLRPRLLGPL
jgi:choice-of-anchor A domain-containing protein